MSIEASVEIGTSGEIFEDVSNPCRQSELRSSYNKMRTTMWPKILKEIEKKSKANREETVDKNEEKERVKKMIKVTLYYSFKIHMSFWMTTCYTILNNFSLLEINSFTGSVYQSSKRHDGKENGP